MKKIMSTIDLYGIYSEERRYVKQCVNYDILGSLLSDIIGIYMEF